MRIDKSFNPETDPKTRKVVAGDANLYFVDLQAIIDTVYQNGKPFTLEESEYGGHIATSKLVVNKNQNGNGECWIYNGEIQWSDKADTELEPEKEAFFRSLGSAGIDSCGFTMEEFYFGNWRLLRHSNSSSLALVRFFGEDQKVHYDNQAYGQSTNNKNVYAGINAPSLADLERRPGAQLMAHVAGHVLTLNALAELLENRPKLRKLIVTSEGPYYPDSNSKSSARKPSTDKELQPQESQTEQESSSNHEADANRRPAFDDIGGLEEVKDEFRKVAFSFKNPEVMKRWGAERPSGVFLYGPPGTGKTTLAKALANEIGGELMEIRATEIHDKWLGNSEKNMQAIFDKIFAKKGPTVVLFDEFEALIASDNSEGGASRSVNAVVGIFKKEMARLKEENPNIIVVATTNNEERVDESLIRAGRFDIKAYVPLPDQITRNQIFYNKVTEMTSMLSTDDFTPFSGDIDMSVLAEATDGMSGADIVEIIRRACFQKAVDDSGSKSTGPITQDELLRIINDLRRE